MQSTQHSSCLTQSKHLTKGAFIIKFCVVNKSVYEGNASSNWSHGILITLHQIGHMMSEFSFFHICEMVYTKIQWNLLPASHQKLGQTCELLLYGFINYSEVFQLNEHCFVTKIYILMKSSKYCMSK